MSTPKKLALAALSFAAAFLVPLLGLRAGRQGRREPVRRPGRGPPPARASPSASASSAARSARAARRLRRSRASRATRAPRPRIQTPMILGLALIESLVLLAFVIAFFLQGFATGLTEHANAAPGETGRSSGDAGRAHRSVAPRRRRSRTRAASQTSAASTSSAVPASRGAAPGGARPPPMSAATTSPEKSRRPRRSAAAGSPGLPCAATCARGAGPRAPRATCIGMS